MMKKNKLFIGLLYLFSTLAFLGFIVILFIHNILPIRYRFYIAGIGILLYIIIGFLILNKSQKKVFYYISFIILILGLTSSALGIYYIQNTISKYNDALESSNTHNVEYKLITYKDNPVDNIDSLTSSDIIYFDESEDKEHIDNVKTRLNKINDKLSYKSDSNTFDLVMKLLNREINYMLFNSSKLDIILSENPDFEDSYKIINISEKDNSIKFDYEVNNITKNVNDGESFNIFISGGDSYSGLYSNTRSDVNMLVTVNPKTNKILLTSIPRDSYVTIHDRGNDKLTHAGIYGMDTLVSTIEDLLKQEINYYAKVNFASLEKLVDELGGVKVDNEVEFTSRIGRHYFPKGEIELNGEEALYFVRERYAFADGDFARGRNQMKVIEAMIEKAISPEILVNYNDILDTGLDSVNTNFPTNKIVEMINQQIDNGSSWKFEQNQISGEPTFGLPSYAMPGYNLSMTEIDEESLDYAIQKINLTLEKSN